MHKMLLDPSTGKWKESSLCQVRQKDDDDTSNLKRIVL